MASGSAIPHASAAAAAGTAAPSASAYSGGGSPGARPSLAAAAASAASSPGPRPSTFQHRRTASGRHSDAFADRAASAGASADADTVDGAAQQHALLGAQACNASSQGNLKIESPAKAAFAGGLSPARGSLRAGDGSMSSEAQRMPLEGASGGAAGARKKRTSVVTWVGQGSAPDVSSTTSEIAPETSGGDGSAESVPARSRTNGGAGPSGRGFNALQRSRQGTGSSTDRGGASVSWGGAAEATMQLRQCSVYSQAALRLAQRRSGGNVPRASAAEGIESGEVCATVEIVRRALFDQGPRTCARSLNLSRFFSVGLVATNTSCSDSCSV